jgi:hypothetical protein
MAIGLFVNEKEKRGERLSRRTPNVAGEEGSLSVSKGASSVVGSDDGELERASGFLS